tara:strand:- start:1002 stop:1724 length:723 start_codon:yes stop_codon:yes gene_type:complete
MQQEHGVTLIHIVQVTTEEEDGEWNLAKNIKTNKNPSILDNLAEMLQDTAIVNVDSEKARSSLSFLRKGWKKWIFGRVIKVKGMGPVHIVNVNKKDGSETYLKNMDEYESMCIQQKKNEKREDSFKKNTKITYEHGFYGWVKCFTGEIAYIHHCNYAQPDFGVEDGTLGIDTQFLMSRKRVTKTPKVGDYVCGIISQSTLDPNKWELTPWFISSYTLFRCINIIKFGHARSDKKRTLVYY